MMAEFPIVMLNLLFCIVVTEFLIMMVEFFIIINKFLSKYYNGDHIGKFMGGGPGIIMGTLLGNSTIILGKKIEITIIKVDR